MCLLDAFYLSLLNQPLAARAPLARLGRSRAPRPTPCSSATITRSAAPPNGFGPLIATAVARTPDGSSPACNTAPITQPRMSGHGSHRGTAERSPSCLVNRAFGVVTGDTGKISPCRLQIQRFDHAPGGRGWAPHRGQVGSPFTPMTFHGPRTHVKSFDTIHEWASTGLQRQPGQVVACVFGVLMLAWMTIGYFSIFDMGLGRAMTQFIARQLGETDRGPISAMFWTGLTLMTALGLLGGLVSIAIAPWLVESVLNVPADLQAETLWSLYLVGFGLPLTGITRI
jgi:hypothetical protein